MLSCIYPLFCFLLLLTASVKKPLKMFGSWEVFEDLVFFCAAALLLGVAEPVTAGFWWWHHKQFFIVTVTIAVIITSSITG